MLRNPVKVHNLQRLPRRHTTTLLHANADGPHRWRRLDNGENKVCRWLRKELADELARSHRRSEGQLPSRRTTERKPELAEEPNKKISSFAERSSRLWERFEAAVVLPRSHPHIGRIRSISVEILHRRKRFSKVDRPGYELGERCSNELAVNFLQLQHYNRALSSRKASKSLGLFTPHKRRVRL